MGRPKGGAAASSSSSKKPKAKPKQRGGVDFKKYKHKVGRKLPPPKNATDTEIKSRAIVLPEQSMASERAGMAVNKRGLTLRELLQQTGHYNANVRRAALNGIKDLVAKHPSELKLHKVAIVEKLQERICDTDKVVRESLFSILQSLVFPSLKEFYAIGCICETIGIYLWQDNAISTRSTLFLLMANILNGMTHLSMDIQLMSFRFLELVVINFPSSFPGYAEQVFNNFLAVLSNDRIHLQDKSKLNSVLSGLGQCLSQVAYATENGDASNRLVHNLSGRELWKCTLDEDNSGSRAFAMSNILMKLQNLFQILVNSVEVSVSELFAKSTIDAQSSEALLSALHCLDLICNICIQEAKTLRNKDTMEKHLSPLITFIPDLVSNAPDDSKGYLLEAFTDAFWDCKVDCKLIFPYLDAVGKMLFPEKTGILFVENDSGSEYHGVWVKELPGILLQSIDKAPSVTKVVLELLLRIGQYFPTMEFGNLRSFIKLFGVKCDVLEPTILFRIIEVLQSTYKAGNLHITEQLSFLSLLMARFRVHPGSFSTQDNSQKGSNMNTFKSLNRLILNSLSEMGDGSLVLELMWDNLSKEIAQIPSLHNMNGLFRIIVTLDAGTCKLMNEDAIKIIAGYLIDAAMDLSKTIELGFQSDRTRLFQYFIKPCIIIFCQNEKVLCCALEMLKSFATGDDHVLSSASKLNYPGELSHRICVVTTILIFLCNDGKLHKNLSLGKCVIKGILQHTRHLMDSNVLDVTYEDKQKLRFAFEQLKTKALQLNCWDRSELEGFSSTTYCRNVKPYSARDENFDELKVKMESGHGDW
uniref:OSJNBa0016O02.4 protein n=1 Tax=Oryza sativa subsp. japonica TaxID=39947 RepID=Q7XJW6_ORYSJ|nr:OSJNBa0016O02.4 [Oryza sativa Japonica Group]